LERPGGGGQRSKTCHFCFFWLKKHVFLGIVPLFLFDRLNNLKAPASATCFLEPYAQRK
jgi:hypothetical protein